MIRILHRRSCKGAPCAVELPLAVDNRWTADEEQTFERLVRDVVENVVGFRIAVVDEIPLTPAGKLQVVLNRCSMPAPSDEIATN